MNTPSLIKVMLFFFVSLMSCTTSARETKSVSVPVTETTSAQEVESTPVLETELVPAEETETASEQEAKVAEARETEAAGASDVEEASVEDAPGLNPEQYLKKIGARYDMPINAGVKAINASLWIVDSYDPELAALKGTVRSDYIWEFPFIDNFNMKYDSPELCERMKGMLDGIWRDIVAGAVFGDLVRMTKTIEQDGDSVQVHLAYREKPRGTVVFDAETGLARSMVILRRGVPYLWEPTYESLRKSWRLTNRKLTIPASEEQGIAEKVFTYRYDDFQRVNRFTLPSKMVIEDEKGSTEFFIEYLFINRSPAIVGDEGLAKVKKKIGYMEENYGQATEYRRLIMMKNLASTGHELAADYILKNMLNDESTQIRLETIQVLGQMRCRNIVRALTEALSERKMERDLFLLYIEAIGKLGDPCSVEPLCSEFRLGWDRKPDRAAASARIAALGGIRSRRAVEALIRIALECDAQGDASLLLEVHESLQLLTRLSYETPDAWEGWWTANSAGYKLAEDE